MALLLVINCSGRWRLDTNKTESKPPLLSSTMPALTFHRPSFVMVHDGDISLIKPRDAI